MFCVLRFASLEHLCADKYTAQQNLPNNKQFERRQIFLCFTFCFARTFKYGEVSTYRQLLLRVWEFRT